MKLLKLGRTFKEGWTIFVRNSWLSVATVSVLFLSLYVIGATLLTGMVANELIGNIEKNVSIGVYFKPDIDESRIKEIENEIKNNEDVSSVEYVSKEQALDKFSNDNKDDPVIADALNEIGENPLLSSIIVKAKDQKKYGQLVDYIESNFSEEMNNINYGKNKDVIERLGKIVATVRKIGIILGAVFISIAILITFNAIRLSLYVRKREFDVMRLVGASNLYIKAPSIFEGMFYGFFASVLAIIAIAGTAYSGLPLIQGLISRNDVINFYLSNFLVISGSILVAGLLVGVVSSMIAIRKYLKA